MNRSKTPSFITEIPLKANPSQESILLKRLVEVYRRQAAHRKSLHGRLANQILKMGDQVKMEKLSYRAFQQVYGRSTQLRARGSS